MKRTKSRIFLIITSIIFTICFAIGGLTLIRQNQNRAKNIVASAETHSSDTLYFEQGASALTNHFSDGFFLRFTVHLSFDEFLGGNARYIPIRLATDVPNVRFASTNIEGASPLQYTYADINSTDWIMIYLSNFTHNDSTGIYTTYIILKVVDPYQNCQLETYGRSGATAISDARSAVYIWEKAIEYDDPAVAGKEETLDKYINRPTGFQIIDQSIVPSTAGLVLDINIPTELIESLQSGSESLTESECREIAGIGQNANYISGEIEYKLDIVRTIEAPSYEGEPSDEEVFTFFGDTAPMGFSLYFGDSYARVTLPLPEDKTQEYYYYARIQERTFVSYKQIEADRFLYLPLPVIKNKVFENIEYIDSTLNYPKFSTQSLSEDILASNYTMTDIDRQALQEIAGIAPSGSEIEVTVKYKAWSENKVVDTSFTFDLPSVYAQCPALVYSSMIKLKPQYSNLDDFNVVSSDYYYTESDGWVHQTDGRIILCVQDYTYVYDTDTEKGTLTIGYEDYQFKDVHIRIANNDPENHLVLDYYPGESRSSEDGTYRTIVFDLDDIETQIYNSCSWMFNLTADDFSITGTTTNVTTTFADDELSVKYKKSNVNDLANVSIMAVVEIVPDEDYTVTYEYRSVNANALSYTTETSDEMTKKYSWLTALNFSNFMTDYGSVINQALSSNVVTGNWLTPTGIEKHEDVENKTCRIVVEYDERSVFALSNNQNSNVKYLVLNTDSLVYTGATLSQVVGVPSGYRLEKISSSSDLVSIQQSDAPATLKVTVRGSVNAGDVIPLRLVFTDQWLLTVNYFVPYKDYRIRSGVPDAAPAFAEKRSLDTSIQVSDYDDIYELDKNDAYDIIHPLDGDFSIDLLGQSTIDDVTVTFDNVSRYTIDLSYSVASLITRGYNGGNNIEIQIPLTSFSEWCDYYDTDWTIKYLNTKDRTYFRYTNDVDRDKLYGFFTVAVFEEHVSDLNYYFQKEGSDGVVSVYSSRAVKGSKVYQFFDRLDGNILGGAIVGKVGMSFCELASDDNKLVYSYFMYLDCSSDVPYYGRNGADDAYDDDSAIHNRIEDGIDFLGGLVNGMFSEENLERGLKVLLGVVLVIVIIIVLKGVISQSKMDKSVSKSIKKYNDQKKKNKKK